MSTALSGQFMSLPVAREVRFTAGMLWMLTMGLPIVKLPASIMGPATPAESSIVIRYFDAMVSAAIMQMRVVSEKGMAIAFMPSFGSGVGMGPAGLGT